MFNSRNQPKETAAPGVSVALPPVVNLKAPLLDTHRRRIIEAFRASSPGETLKAVDHFFGAIGRRFPSDPKSYDTGELGTATTEVIKVAALCFAIVSQQTPEKTKAFEFVTHACGFHVQGDRTMRALLRLASDSAISGGQPEYLEGADVEWAKKSLEWISKHLDTRYNWETERSDGVLFGNLDPDKFPLLAVMCDCKASLAQRLLTCCVEAGNQQAGQRYADVGFAAATDVLKLYDVPTHPDEYSAGMRFAPSVSDELAEVARNHVSRALFWTGLIFKIAGQKTEAIAFMNAANSFAIHLGKREKRNFDEHGPKPRHIHQLADLTHVAQLERTALSLGEGSRSQRHL